MHHRRSAGVAGLTASTLTATLLLGATPAVSLPADAAPTRGLPGTGELSDLATARPADVAEAERQFLARTPERFRDQEPVWAPCPPGWLQAPQNTEALECASVQVPRDWNAPEVGEPLSVAISRAVRDGERPQRSVITNPGGPGGAGLDLAAGLSRRPALAGTEVIGLDVRGTGASTPLLCDPTGLTAISALPDTRDRSPQALDAVAAGVATLAKACQADELADLVNTEQTVADIDLVRDALGRDTIDWVGYSGGTWVGSQYATYFPGRVGRFVLDSNVDATASFQEVFTDNQPAAMQRRFEVDFAAWAGEHHRLFRLGTSTAEVVGSYESLRAAYTARPLPLPSLGLAVNGDILDALVIQAMYSKASFETLAWTLFTLRTIDTARTYGDPAVVDRAVGELYGRLTELLPVPPAPGGEVPPHQLTMVATFTATTCNDTAWTTDRAYWDDHAADLGPRFPVLGWSQNRKACPAWDRPDLTLPLPDGRDLPPLLMVQTERDAPTSYEGALRTHAALPTSRLITVADDGDHGVYGMAGNPCVDEIVDAFLTTGAAPDDDVTCATTGIPAPGSALPGVAELREAIRD